MHELTLLINIAVALVAAFIGGLIARRLGLPTIVGYLLAGIVIGPFTPGFVGDTETIGQLAELGVIFLMFGVGLHFSFNDLWRVRGVAIPGAVGQTLANANLRARTGASVVAILRDKQLMANPKSMTVFEAGDRIGLIGHTEQIEAIEKLFGEVDV